MTPVTVTSRTTWDTALTRLPNPQTLQSWDWGEFKSRWGWQPTRLLWSDDSGVPVAAAQILSRPIPKTPWQMRYVPRGPIVDYDDPMRVAQILADIEENSRQENALFIKIDPDIALAYGIDAVPNLRADAVKSLLSKRGWLYAPQQIQFKNTVLLDLSPSEDALLTAMKSKWRYNIRLAGRKGVAIKQGTIEDLDIFYDMYAITSQRDGFFIRPKAYYVDVWQQYLAANRATLLLATVEDIPISGLMLFFFHQTAWYMYGASTGQHRNLMPNHLLQWKAIQAAKQAGCTTYDMWGAPNAFDESDSMWGVYRFKLGFNGTTHHGLGAYDFPIHPLKYRLYNQLLPKILSLIRNTFANAG